MRFRDWFAGTAVVALVWCGPGLAQAEDDGLAEALKSQVAGHVAAYDKKDAATAMSFVDTRSPDYESTKEAVTEQLQGPEVDVKLAGFDYVGHDDEFAYARVKLKSTGKPDSGFVDNTVDSVMIFHYQDGAWKLWTQKVLGVDIAQAEASR